MNNTEVILRQRAIKAAKKMDVSEKAEGMDVIYFRIGNEKYAIEAESVSEVHTFMELTPIPYAPSYIHGIFHMRGRFVSVINLKCFFGMETQSGDVPRTILLLDNGEMEFGVAVDAVLEHSKLSKKTLQAIPSDLNLPRPDLIVGVSEEGVIVLNGKKFLGDSSMVVHQEVATSNKGKENVK